MGAVCGFADKRKCHRRELRQSFAAACPPAKLVAYLQQAGVIPFRDAVRIPDDDIRQRSQRVPARPRQFCDVVPKLRENAHGISLTRRMLRRSIRDIEGSPNICIDPAND